MAATFINVFNDIFKLSRGDTATGEQCVENISHYEWYQFALIPAALVTLSLLVTKKRRNLFQDIWNGRPGLIYPMDTLSRTSRISYACCFGATTFLVYEIVLYNKTAIYYSGDNRAVKTFVLIASMFVYGMVFFPLFTSLAMGSMYGYFIGSLYAWLLTIMEAYRTFQCPVAQSEGAVLLFFRGLPSFLCLLYLCVSLPVRTWMTWRRGHYFRWREDRQEENTLSYIRDSYVGHYVTKLFQKPELKQPLEKKRGLIVGTLLSLAYRFLYKNKRGFRYPGRILSVNFTALMIVYMLSFESLALEPRFFDVLASAIEKYIDVNLGSEATPNENPDTTELLRKSLWALIKVINAIKVCIIVSVVAATLFAVLNVLHNLSSYRANLLALYMGDHSHTPPVSSFSNISHCINSIKFGGFQVGYIVWSYIIQGFLLFLVSFILAVIILLLMYDFISWFVLLLQLIWPILLTIVIGGISQYLLSKLVFLQERGALLALNNRSVYFNFTYFMFFYNVFLGLMSCILRILNAMLVGIAFLGRLDSSTMPRRFEFFDPGFRAYVGYMHVEAAHSHPVLVLFCRLMLLGLSDKREREVARSNEERQGLDGQDRSPIVCVPDDIELMNRNPTCVRDVDHGEQEEQRRRRRVAARFNWHLTYTLLHNPDIRVMRKGYLHMLRQVPTMDLNIPVSDRQDDVDFQQLQELNAEERDKRDPKSSKRKNKEEEEEDGEVELKEVEVEVEVWERPGTSRV